MDSRARLVRCGTQPVLRKKSNASRYRCEGAAVALADDVGKARLLMRFFA